MKYKVLKEFLTVKNPRWLKPGEVIDGQPSGARIKALLEKKYIEEIPEQPKTVDDLGEGDEGWFIYGGVVKKYACMDIVELKCFKEMVAAGDGYLTKEEAEKELAHRKAKVILERDTKGFRANPKKGNLGWGISYEFSNSYIEGHLVVDCCDWIDGTIRFATAEDANISINKHANEWKTYLGVEE